MPHDAILQPFLHSHLRYTDLSCIDLAPLNAYLATKQVLVWLALGQVNDRVTLRLSPKIPCKWRQRFVFCSTSKWMCDNEPFLKVNCQLSVGVGGFSFTENSCGEIRVLMNDRWTWWIVFILCSRWEHPAVLIIIIILITSDRVMCLEHKIWVYINENTMFVLFNMLSVKSNITF